MFCRVKILNLNQAKLLIHYELKLLITLLYLHFEIASNILFYNKLKLVYQIKNQVYEDIVNLK